MTEFTSCEECAGNKSTPYHEGQWYWVTDGKGNTWPAIYNNWAVGKWSNGDTWEDFGNDVVKAELIELPSWHKLTDDS